MVQSLFQIIDEIRGRSNPDSKEAIEGGKPVSVTGDARNRMIF